MRLKWVCRTPGREAENGAASGNDGDEEEEQGWDECSDEGGGERGGGGTAMLESFELVPITAAASPPLALHEDADGVVPSPTLFIEAASLLARLAGSASCPPGLVLSATVPLVSATHVAAS